jgi:hypothetical protein
MANEFLLLGSSSAALSGVLSVTALAVSGFAAWRANQQTAHVQRQADTALGDLLPNFSLHLLTDADADDERPDSFLLRIDNHNRRPVGITKLTIRQPRKTGLVAYRMEPGKAVLLGKSLERKHNEVAPDLVVDGTRPGAPSVASVTLKLVIAGKAGPAGKRRDRNVTIEVDYEILSATPEQHSETVSSRAAGRG